MKLTDNQLKVIAETAGDTMTKEECMNLLKTVTEDMQKNREFDDFSRLEKILWTVRAAYVAGFMQATTIFNESPEGEPEKSAVTA